MVKMLKQKGQIFLWRYKDNTRNYPGWHLCADCEGCQFVFEVLNLFNQDFRVWRSASLQPPVLAQRTNQYASLRTSAAPRISSKRESPVNKFQKRNFLLNISNPTSEILSVPNNQRGAARWQSPKKLKLSFNPDLNFNELWNFSFDKIQPVLEFGRNGIEKFQKGIQDITNGKGDYSIGGHESESNEESTCVWFWWYPKAL